MCLDKRPLDPDLPDRASPQKADMANTTADATNPKTIETQAMITALKGTAIRVPNLYGILKGWPVKANINYKRLIPVIESTFDRLVKPSQLREKYRKANYARFVSLYYPHPKWDQVRILALYIIWLFCWDDAIDQQGTGDLSNDILHAKAHRDNTIRVLEHFLGLAPPKTKLSVELQNANPELKMIGDKLQMGYSLEQRQTFMTQMRRYIDNCHEEQKMRLQGTLPDIESYSELRHGTAAVWTLCALIEYGLSDNIPEDIRHMGQIQTIWSETSRAIWITNDILSLRKEIPKEGSESIVNAIPILMKHKGISPQQAVDDLLAELATSVTVFEEAAGILEQSAGKGGQELMKTYCDACRCMVTGSIQFTLESSRYKLEGCLNEDGSLDILL
ncbi:Terpene synthase family protein [Colletotrichum higginsianum IMI 349063]|uniref:Terpene synthase n=3 Tax=Colletotrichum higginsianum TaxID=80884 RepID=A0A1B7XZ66_COLHI|nr:Terpene synthase family protein [Colletotrichum higginsianum IMI 349063]OBR05021.1 Terpene synthase family protein [Colletotrichum higginsianum IMI 349063]